MCSRGVLVHCLSRLGTATAVLAAEIQCGDGVFATRAHERSEAAHHLDRVVSHSFKCSPLSVRAPEPKLRKLEARVNPCALVQSVVLDGCGNRSAGRRARPSILINSDQPSEPVSLIMATPNALHRLGELG